MDIPGSKQYTQKHFNSGQLVNHITCSTWGVEPTKLRVAESDYVSIYTHYAMHAVKET